MELGCGLPFWRQAFPRLKMRRRAYVTPETWWRGERFCASAGRAVGSFSRRVARRRTFGMPGCMVERQATAAGAHGTPRRWLERHRFHLCLTCTLASKRLVTALICRLLRARCYFSRILQDRLAASQSLRVLGLRCERRLMWLHFFWTLAGRRSVNLVYAFAISPSRLYLAAGNGGRQNTALLRDGTWQHGGTTGAARTQRAARRRGRRCAQPAWLRLRSSAFTKLAAACGFCASCCCRSAFASQPAASHRLGE